MQYKTAASPLTSNFLFPLTSSIFFASFASYHNIYLVNHYLLPRFLEQKLCLCRICVTKQTCNKYMWINKELLYYNKSIKLELLGSVLADAPKAGNDTVIAAILQPKGKCYNSSTQSMSMHWRQSGNCFYQFATR